MNKIGEFNQTNVTELILYIQNDGDLYRSSRQCIELNLLKKLYKGTYQHDMAIVAWSHLVDFGAKKYVKELCSPDDNWTDIFDKADRNAAAYIMARDYIESVKLGESDGVEVFKGKHFDLNTAGILPKDLIDIEANQENQ